jgi:hypothetical protein
MPKSAITISCASKSAVKCVFGRTFQGILAACTPSLGQSALGSAQCTIVSYCQMSRCLQVLSRVSQVPHLLWHTGHSTTWPFLWATLTWSLSCAPSRSLNQTSQSSHSSLSPKGSLKEPCQHACLKHPYRTLRTQPPVGENPTVRRPHAQEDVGVLPTISSEESRMIREHLPASRLQRCPSCAFPILQMAPGDTAGIPDPAADLQLTIAQETRNHSGHPLPHPAEALPSAAAIQPI